MNAIDALLQGKKGVVATKKTGKVSAIDQLLQKKPVKPTIQPVKTTLPTQQNYIKATLPKDLGGGSYYLQRGEPNKLITPEATKTYGSLKPKTGQERDHFIAQSLGGASEDYNLNYVPSEVNQAWGHIETKNLNAYKRGEISLPQARLNVLKEKQEWLMKQKGISQSVKDNLIYAAKDPVNPVNTVRAVLKMVKSPVSLVKEYAKAIMPKTTAELETQIEAQKKSNQPMRFEVGAGMSNVEKVLPGPRISTLEAIQQGAQIEPVQAGEAPQVSPVRQAQQVVRKPDLSPEKPSAIDKLLSGVSAVSGAIRASSVAASLPISLTVNAFSKEKLPARDIIEATSKMIEDEMREGGTASTAKGAQLYLASRGIGKYGGEDVNVGDIAVLSLIGLGDIMGDPVFYFGAIKPALNQLKFNLEYKKVGQVGLKAKPGVKITNPQKSIIDVGDDLKMVIDPKAKKVTLKGYAKRGVTGKPINEKAIVNVANNISEQVGVPISSKVVGNDIVLSAGKGAMANVSKTTKPIVSPEIPAKPSVEIPVKSPEPQIKPQKAQGDVLPTKTTKVSPEAKPSVVEPLIEEAKKYKSADEFVKAQGTPVYRGDATPIKLSEMDTTKVFNPAEKEALGAFNNTPGLYFTDSVANAKSYGKNLTEVSVKPTANVINVSDAPKILKRADVEKIIRSNPRIKDWAMNWDENFDKAIKQITDSVMVEKDGNEFLKAIWSDGGFSEGDFVKAMQNAGIDGLKVPKEGVNHFVIYNKDAIQTKSQLTEIWNKAHKEVKPEVKLEEKPIPKELEPLAQEARKYGSAEEFVRGIKNKVDISFTKGKPSSSILENVFKALSPKEQKELFTRMPSRRVYDRWFRKTAVEDMALNPEARLVMKELPTPYLLEKGKEVPVINISGNNIPLSEAEFKYYQAIKSQLTDFYNQAVKGTKEVKEVKKPTLPKRQPPKNIPPKKPAVVKSKTANQELIGKSKLAQGVEAKAIAKKLTEGFADLPEYEKINIKDQATKARKLLEDDYPRAERIALGKELPPEGILPESVFIAVENRAIKNKDVNTLRRLATESGLSNEATLMGQRIRTLAERVEDSPTAVMAKVIKNRKEYYALKHKTPLDEAIKRETKKIKSYVKPVKEDEWIKFINELTC